jgi:hypothetical protein
MTERTAMVQRMEALQAQIATINADIDWLVDSSGQGGGLVDTLYKARYSAWDELNELRIALDDIDNATDWDSMAEAYRDAAYYADGAGL